LSQYCNSDVTNLVGRNGWPGTMRELEIKQNNAAVIHCWKPYYFPTELEKEEVKNSLFDLT